MAGQFAAGLLIVLGTSTRVYFPYYELRRTFDPYDEQSYNLDEELIEVWKGKKSWGKENKSVKQTNVL